MSNVPPAIRRPPKPVDRGALLADVEYFLSEVIQRLGALRKMEASARTELTWEQTALICRRTRGVVREQRGELAHQEKINERRRRAHVD